MNGPAIVLSSVLLATGGAYVVTAWSQPKPSAGEPGAAAPMQADRRLREIEDKLEQTLGRVEQLRQRLDALPEVRTPTEPISAAAIEAAVAKWMDAKGAASASASGPKPSFSTTQEALARLGETGGDFDEMVALWKEIDKADLGDEVLAWFENQAKASPGDAEAQYKFGSAMIVALQNKPVTMQGELAMKADAAFDRALKADDHHWGARFSKATSLSFWPKITGKQAEAMKHFEVLMAQQETTKTRPEFAQTYLFLGNMYQDNGRREDAKAIYERGLRYFPGNAGLQAQLAATGK